MNSKKETSPQKIAFINFILSSKMYFKKNILESNKFIATISTLFVLKLILKIKDPRSRFIPNNISIPKKIIDKNYVIDVTLKSANPTNNFENYKENNNFKIKHIPYFNFMHKIVNNSSIKSSSKDIQVEDLLHVKLAGVSKISSEGRYVIERLIRSNSFSFSFKFNHIRHHDTVEIYGWLFFKSKRSFRTNNLNIFLVKNGYAEIDHIKDNAFDEKIYYYYTDLINADKLARSRGIGIWEESKSYNVSESLMYQGAYNKILHKIRKWVNMRAWEKAIMTKKH